MECVHENVGTNLVKAYMSWNVPNQKSNKRLTVSSIFLSLNVVLLGCYKKWFLYLPILCFVESKWTYAVKFFVYRRHDLL